MATKVELTNKTYKCVVLSYCIYKGNERLQSADYSLDVKVTAKQVTFSDALINGSRVGRKIVRRDEVLSYEHKGNLFMIFKDEKDFVFKNPMEHRGEARYTLVLLQPPVNVSEQLIPCFKVYTRSEYTRQINGMTETKVNIYTDLYSSLRYTKDDILRYHTQKDMDTVFTVHKFIQLHRNLCIDYGYTECLINGFQRYKTSHEAITYKDLKATNPFIEPTIMTACRARRDFCNSILEAAHHPKRVEYVINTYGFDAWANQDDGY